MRHLTLRVLLLITACAFAGSWVVDLLTTGAGASLLSLPWAAGIALLFQAAVLLLVGLRVRRMRDGDRDVRMDRTWAVVAVAMAQANALAGALIAGWHGLLTVNQVMLLSVRSDHSALWLVGAMTVIGVVLCVVGWLVEGFCRLPPDEPEDSGSQPSPRNYPAQEGGMARVRGNRKPPNPHSVKGAADD